MIFTNSNATDKRSVVTKLIVYLLILCPISLLLLTPDLALSETRKIAIAPFEINSQKDLSYIRNGIFQMLSSRLAWRDNLIVITEKEVADSLIPTAHLNSDRIKGGKATPNTGGSSDSDVSALISKIATGTGSDYVIKGSITEFAGAFSVDVAVFNIRQNSSQPFFTQAETPEKIIPGVERLSAKINRDIFNRETSDLTLADEDKNSPSLNTIRANPEKLMPQPTIEQSEKKRPFWKFWGKEKNRDDDGNVIPDNGPTASSASNKLEPEEDIVIHTESDTEEQEEERSKKPFWKFW